MTEFTPGPALVGGTLIGFSASLLLWLLGRVAGISGIAGGLLSAARGDRAWRLAFLAGLFAGGFSLHWFYPRAFEFEVFSGIPTLVAAGLLVGFGTRLGSGCTSGHGVCGLARRSPRSLAATALFMAAGMGTVLVIRHLMGGKP